MNEYGKQSHGLSPSDVLFGSVLGERLTNRVICKSHIISLESDTTYLHDSPRVDENEEEKVDSIKCEKDTIPASHQ